MLFNFKARHLSKTEPRNLNISPRTAIAVSESKEGEISIGHHSHNNGGYRNIVSSLDEILSGLADAGTNMMEFKTPYGRVFVNIHHDIPFALLGDRDNENRSRLPYPTHNNGGYPLNQHIDDAAAKINKALKDIPLS